jgi:carbon-monoxide dehydrogenase medium subunit
VKPALFRYVRARTVDEAIRCLSEDADARILAGGQSLVPMLNMRLVRPSTIIDINRLPDLDSVRAAADGGLELGALVRHAELTRSKLVRDRAPLLATAASHIGHRAIRNRGTLGGSLAHADPAAELPAAAVALDAQLVLAGPAGERVIPAAEFFAGLFTTALRPGELLTGVRLRPAPGRLWGFAELARRPGDFALAGVCGTMAAGADGQCASARLVAFGVGAGPVRLLKAEALLVGRRLDGDAARAAGAAAGTAVEPFDDVHASGEYRRHLVSVLTERAVLAALGHQGRNDG